MHMSDALISPVVGGALWAGSAIAASYAVKKLKVDLDDKKIPLMGVMGAFVFASQMINFTIPGTGSSGHIGGGMLLAVLLGPYAGFLTMATVLAIQALLFADGGLLAFGCNLFNLGFYTCFVAYPLIFKPITKKSGRKNLMIASVISSVTALQLGALSVVLQTAISGRTTLPVATFAMFMQPIHLAIGLLEGFITSAVVLFLHEARPDLVSGGGDFSSAKGLSYKRILGILAAAVLAIGGLLSWYASEYPDGLEWSIQKITGEAELESDHPVSEALAQIQEKTAVLPDYQFKNPGETSASDKTGTSFSGIIGSAITMGIVAFMAFVIHLIKKRRRTV